MASMDNLEGELIEGGLLALLVVLALAAYAAWKSGKDLAGWLHGLLSRLLDAFSVSGGYLLAPRAVSGDASGDGSGNDTGPQIRTGGNMGDMQDAAIAAGALILNPDGSTSPGPNYQSWLDGTLPGGE